MTFHRWLQNLRSAVAPSRANRTPQRRGLLGAATYRLHFESLEDRRLMAFLAPVDYTAGLYADDVKVGDFNGDAVLDLAAANWYGGSVSVLLGNSDGTFQPAQTSALGPTPGDATVGPYPQSLTVGDFNADGKLDLAASTYDYYGTDGNDVLILLGNGDGTFADFVPQNVAHGYSTYIASGDLNADGKLDLVVTSNAGSGLAGNAVSVLLGHGDGTFALDRTYNGNGANGSIGQLSVPALADFDSDGNVDVAMANWFEVKVFLGNGDGALQVPRNFATNIGATSIAVGDFNADGNPDLAMNNSILLGNGDGTFQPGQDFAGGGAVVGDVNNDGVLDLVTDGGILLGRGDGSFTLPITSDTSAYFVVLGDFNADGRVDAAGASGSSTVSVLLNDGNWSSLSPTPPAVRIHDVTITEGNTGTVAAGFTVTLSAASTQTVTVAFATGNGSAVSGSDYQAATGTLVIPAGLTTGTITVLVNGDRLAELNETFFVNLSGPIGASIADTQGVATILDDEPRISISDVTKAEGRKGQTTLFTFTVTLSAAYDQPVTMSYRTANGTATTGNGDYIAKTGTLTFAPGETTKTITIEVKGDSKREGNETFCLDLFGNSSNSLFAKNRGIGTILNDD